jgi:hypothetical protein
VSGVTAALLATLLVEVPIIVAFYPCARGRALFVALAANVVTNSLMNGVWFSIVPWPTIALVSGEALSFGFEAFLYSRVMTNSRERAIAASATANLASFVLGPLVMRLLRA